MQVCAKHLGCFSDAELAEVAAAGGFVQVLLELLDSSFERGGLYGLNSILLRLDLLVIVGDLAGTLNQSVEGFALLSIEGMGYLVEL